MTEETRKAQAKGDKASLSLKSGNNGVKSGVRLESEWELVVPEGSLLVIEGVLA